MLQCIAQTYLDEALLEDDSDEMREFIDWRKWRMAERYIIRAFTIDSDNAEILYTMGKVRKVSLQDDIAIYCFEKILKTKPGAIGKGPYGRGTDFGKELINDARFELYRLHYETNPKLSKYYLATFKKFLDKGVTTIFEPLERFLMKE